MVPEVVGAHVLDADNCTGGGPRVGQILPPEGEPCRSGEDEGISRRPYVVLELVLEGMKDESWERDRAATSFRLGGSEDPTQAGELKGCALHCHRAVERVDVPALETKQVSASLAGEAAEEHEASEPGLDRFGELENRRRCEHRAFTRMLDAGTQMVHVPRPISPSARAVFTIARNSR